VTDGESRIAISELEDFSVRVYETINGTTKYIHGYDNMTEAILEFLAPRVEGYPSPIQIHQQNYTYTDAINIINKFDGYTSILNHFSDSCTSRIEMGDLNSVQTCTDIYYLFNRAIERIFLENRPVLDEVMYGITD
jgi:hypothetical protein